MGQPEPKVLFDRRASDAVKGIALLLLLWHHLFYTTHAYGELTHLVALGAKVCVAIFVFLSGYGLSASVRARPITVREFYLYRMSSLYLNYWLIAGIFIAIGLTTDLRPLESAYDSHAVLKLIIQLLGLHRVVYDEYGYNATWWFMSLIVLLYILFPVLYDVTQRHCLLAIGLSLLCVPMPPTLYRLHVAIPAVEEYLLLALTLFHRPPIGLFRDGSKRVFRIGHSGDGSLDDGGRREVRQPFLSVS